MNIYYAFTFLLFNTNIAVNYVDCVFFDQNIRVYPVATKLAHLKLL